MPNAVAASAQLSARDQYAIFVGIDPLAGAHSDASNINDDVFLAQPLAETATRMRGQRADTDLAGIELGAVTHAAVDDDAGPAIFLSQLAKIAADQRAAQAAAAIDDQYSALLTSFRREWLTIS